MKQLANASHAIIALRFVLQFFCTAFIIAWNLCVYSNNIPHTGINEKTGRRFWKETHIVYIFRKTNIVSLHASPLILSRYIHAFASLHVFLSGVFPWLYRGINFGSFHCANNRLERPAPARILLAAGHQLAPSEMVVVNK